MRQRNNGCGGAQSALDEPQHARYDERRCLRVQDGIANVRAQSVFLHIRGATCAGGLGRLEAV